MIVWRGKAYGIFNTQHLEGPARKTYEGYGSAVCRHVDDTVLVENVRHLGEGGSCAADQRLVVSRKIANREEIGPLFLLRPRVILRPTINLDESRFSVEDRNRKLREQSRLRRGIKQKSRVAHKKRRHGAVREAELPSRAHKRENRRKLEHLHLLSIRPTPGVRGALPLR